MTAEHLESRAHATTGSRPVPPARRPLVVHTMISLDGYVVASDEDMSWVIAGFDRDMQNDIAIEMHDRSDCFLFGRVTYQIFAAYWPNAVPYDVGDALKPADGKEDPRIIRALAESPKVVFSRTLGPQHWRGTRVVASGLEEEVLRLRDVPGKSINVQGSTTIVQALQRADLVDAYQLYVHPVLLGAGKLLFGGQGRQDFERVGFVPYANGVTGMRYARKR